MSPLIRGRFFPEIENAGPAKRKLDVLLWIDHLTDLEISSLDRVEILREYLLGLKPPHCAIQIHVPDVLGATRETLSRYGVESVLIEAQNPARDGADPVLAELPGDLQVVVRTALKCDADIIVTKQLSWFPYVTEFDQLGILLTSAEVLERQCEIFVRGHDIPWSFDYIACGSPWTTFYQMGESRLFTGGTRFLDKVHRAGLDFKTEDDARMLIFNRLANLCFTRDRLLFLEFQQAAAKRAKWTRQDSAFEAAYYLNFYYLLIFGGFDHLAVVVNEVLGLGLEEREVAAMGQRFLAALRATDPGVGLGPKPETVSLDSSFIEWRESHEPVSKDVYKGVQGKCRPET